MVELPTPPHDRKAARCLSASRMPGPALVISLTRAVAITPSRSVARGCHSRLCTGALGPKREGGHYTINEAQMCFSVGTQGGVPANRVTLPASPGLFDSKCCSSSVNPRAAFCFSGTPVQGAGARAPQGWACKRQVHAFQRTRSTPCNLLLPWSNFPSLNTYPVPEGSQGGFCQGGGPQVPCESFCRFWAFATS